MAASFGPRADRARHQPAPGRKCEASGAKDDWDFGIGAGFYLDATRRAMGHALAHGKLGRP